MPSFYARARAKIRDFLGRPVDEGALTSEQGRPDAGARSHQLEDLFTMSPARLISIIRQADQGDIHDLAAYTSTVVRLDGHFGAQVRARRMALAARPWKVEALEDKDEAIAEEVRDLLNSPAFLVAVFGLQDAVVGPLSAIEILWETSERQWKPRGFASRDLRWLYVTPEGDVRLRSDAGIGHEELRPFSWMLHRAHLYPGYIARDGLARGLCALRLVKSLGVRAWTEFAEIYGVPLRVVKYPNNADSKQRATYRRMMERLGLDGWAAIPMGSNLEIHEPPSATGGDFHERLVRWANDEASKAIVAQTMTADDGSSRSQSEVHLEMFRAGIVGGDARLVAATTVRDLVDPYLQLNHGITSAGVLKIGPDLTEEVPLDSWINAIAELVDRGLPVAASSARDRLLLPEPGKDEPILLPLSGSRLAAPAEEIEDDDEAAEVDKPVDDEGEGEGVDDEVDDEDERQPNAQRHAQADDDDEDEVDKVAARADIGAAAAEYRLPVEAAAGASTSLEDFRRRLEALRFTPEKTVAGLATWSLAARGLGDDRDER